MDAHEAHEIHKLVSARYDQYTPGHIEGCLSCDFEPVPETCPQCRRPLKFSRWSHYSMWRCDGRRGYIPLLGRFWRAFSFGHGRHYTFRLPVEE
jgi:hypothetical protein